MSSQLITTTNNINNFDNYLISKLNTEEEKQFSLHFKLYLDYEYNNINSFPIDFDNVWKWCQFTQKIHAKRLLLKFFKENKDYIIKQENEELLRNVPQQFFPNENDNRINNGGHNKETIMLSVNTFKEFCMRASTTKAKEIRDYYIKLEQIFFLYMKEQLENKDKEVKQLTTSNNKIYKNVYTKQNVVYVMKLQTIDNDNFIIKIGKTDDIKDRTSALSAHYGCSQENPLVILNVYPCEDNYRFEQFLHNYPEINNWKYTDLINNKVSSTETYIVNETKYNRIKKIIEYNIHLYNAKNLDELREKNKTYELQIRERELKLEEENPELYKLKYETTQKELELLNNPEMYDKYIKLLELKNSTLVSQELKEPEPQYKKEEYVYNVPKKPLTEQGPYVQVYDGNDITNLLYVYSNIKEAIRNIEETSFTGIKKAHKNKEIYKGYRWNLVERNEGNQNEVKDIGEPSNNLRQKTESLIAVLDIDKKNIEKVFLKQKEVAEYIGQVISAISPAIKYEKPISNKYVMLWDMLDEKIKNKYLENNEIPILIDKINGKKVQQIDPNTNEVVNTYLSMVEVNKKLKISDKTIKKYSKNNKIYNGYKWAMSE